MVPNSNRRINTGDCVCAHACVCVCVCKLIFHYQLPPIYFWLKQHLELERIGRTEE